MSTIVDRMPPLAAELMSPQQKKAADELTAGPRGGVKGPFIPLLRSPELMARLQKVGEYLRFESAIPKRLNEFTTLVVSRHWTQQFEWAVHYPLAAAAGTSNDVLDALAAGRRPEGMSDDEALCFDFCLELQANKSVSNDTYARAVGLLGEQGLIDLVTLIGYFTTLAMVMNVAGTPAPAGGKVAALRAFAA